MIDLVVDVARLEERLIHARLTEWARVNLVDARRQSLPRGEPDAAVVRPISMYTALYAAAAYQARIERVYNRAETIAAAGDKMLAYALLASSGLPVPRSLVALTPEAAVEAGERLGYPLVVKPPVGSWGRLVAKAPGPEKLEQLARLRSGLPCPGQRAMIIQELVETGGKDIRCIVVAGELLGCIERRARPGEWRSNVALGATTSPVKPGPELEDLAVRAAAAVKGFFVSIDFFETGEGYLVNEVNGVPEFKGFMRATGVNPAEALSRALRAEIRA